MATLYFNDILTGNGDWNTVGSKSSGYHTFIDQPADGDTLTINDIVFEFDNDSSVSGSNVSVAIGEDLSTTLSTLATLIESNVNVTATVLDGWNIGITSNIVGTIGRYTLSKTSDVINPGDIYGESDGNWYTDSELTTQTSVLPSSGDDVITSDEINSNSGSEPTINNFTINGSGVLRINLTVTDNATFNNTSYNSGTVTGTNVIFNNKSYNLGTINSSNITWNGFTGVNTNGRFNNGQSDPTLTFNFYYNSAVDTDWNNVNNWWMNSDCTEQAYVLPAEIDNVIFLTDAECLSNSGSTPTVKSLTLN